MSLSTYFATDNEDERKRIGKLIETVALNTRNEGRRCKNVRILATDKGYNAGSLRNFIKKKGIKPQIPRKMDARKN